MDLFDVARACIRRWYVFLPIVVLAGLSSILLVTLAKPAYNSQALVGLALPPLQPQAADPLPRNGLMDAGGAMMITNVIAGSLTERSVKDQVVAAGGKDNYTAKMFPPTANGEQVPLVVVQASEPDPDSASKTVELATAQTKPVTRRMQEAAGVPVDQMVRPVVVSAPTAPAPSTRGPLKAAIAIFLIGVVVAVLAAVVVEALIMRRNARDDARRPASMRARHGADPGGRSTTDNEAEKAPSNEAEKAPPQGVDAAGEATVANR